MFRTYFSIAALIALGGSAPALAAAAQAPATRPAAPPAAQAAPATRAALVRNVDANFKAIDTNGDGTLSAVELGAAESKVQQRRLAQMRTRFEGDFAKLDTNKDGQLSKVEFMVAAPRTPATAPNGAKIVTQLDRNKDGKVSGDEYRAPIVARFDALDANRDGVINPSERQAAATPRKN